jgi:hypothetical protein
MNSILESPYDRRFTIRFIPAFSNTHLSLGLKQINESVTQLEELDQVFRQL